MHLFASTYSRRHMKSSLSGGVAMGERRGRTAPGRHPAGGSKVGRNLIHWNF